jgi:hypothetical protein
MDCKVKYSVTEIVIGDRVVKVESGGALDCILEFPGEITFNIEPDNYDVTDGIRTLDIPAHPEDVMIRLNKNIKVDLSGAEIVVDRTAEDEIEAIIMDEASS